MDKALRELAEEYWLRRSQGEALSPEEWCAQHPEHASSLPGAIKALEPLDPTLQLETEPLPGPGAKDEEDTGEEETVKTTLFDNRYRILKVLGEGGFGKVYLVEDSFHNNARLALKLVKAEHQNTEAFRKRFQLEIRVLRALHHEGIPPIHNDGVTPEGEVYFTMEFVQGRSLQDILKSGKPLGTYDVGNYVRQMVSTLEYAHSRGVVHRDLKPGNVLIAKEGTPEAQVMILDFGIAKVLKKEGALEDAMSMQTESAIGTPHYMAPEQIKGLEVDGKTDLYALGVMIYRMLAGDFPFKGKTSMEIMAARMHEQPTPLPSDTQPAWAAPLVRELLSKDRAQRPDTKQIEAIIERGFAVQAARKRPLLLALSVLALVSVALFAWRPWSVASPESLPSSPGSEAAQAQPVEADPGPLGGANAGERDPQQPAPTDQDASGASTIEPATTEPLALDAEPTPTPAGGPRPSATFLPQGGAVQVFAANPARLTGRVVHYSGDQVRVGQELVQVQADGGFQLELELEPGLQSVSVVDLEGTTLAIQQLLLDLTKPTLRLDLPEEGYVTGEASYGLSGSVSDEHGLEQLLCNGEALQPALDGSFTHQVALATEGVHVLRVSALDRAGHRSSAELELTVDRTPPRVTLDDLFSLTTTEEALGLSGVVEELHLESLKLNGRELTVSSGGRFAEELELTLGANELHLQATDRAGLQWEQRWQLERLAPVALVPAGCSAVLGAELQDGWASQVLHTQTGLPLILVPASAVLPAYYLGRTEVTRGQYARLASLPATSATGLTDSHPVADLTFDEAWAWCDRAGLRLPTQAEWLHAAGSASYPWGEDWNGEQCNWGGGSGQDRFAESCPVDALPGDSNPLGHLGLAGNLSEWCDAGGSAGQSKTDPARRRLIGGSYADQRAEQCKTNVQRPQGRLPRARPSIGFRVALDATQD